MAGAEVEVADTDAMHGALRYLLFILILSAAGCAAGTPTAPRQFVPTGGGDSSGGGGGGGGGMSM